LAKNCEIISDMFLIIKWYDKDLYIESFLDYFRPYFTDTIMFGDRKKQGTSYIIIMIRNDKIKGERIMTKSLMLSIQPKHLVNILNGYKTLELRKTVPKDFKGWVYIYCTKSKKDILHKYKDKYYTNHYLTFTDSAEVLNSKVVARFWFDETYYIKQAVNVY